MAINRVNTPEEEQSFKFLSNQSSILHTIDTNNITVNGENVIVDKPKRGDIMCLANDKNKIVWIDGLSINLKQLPTSYEAIGICLSVKGNKAMVRYREERDMRWLAADYWVLSQNDIDYAREQTLRFTIDGQQNSNLLKLSKADSLSLDRFAEKINQWFKTNNANYSAKLEKDPLNPEFNFLVVYGRFTENNWRGDFGIYVVGSGNLPFRHFPDTSFKSPLKCIKGYWLNSGMNAESTGGCCRAKFYDYINANQVAPTGPMNAIHSVPNSDPKLFPLSQMPATKEDFEHNSNCKFLRDHFANYDEYLESWMIKFPCGAGGTITEFPCGKENTYILRHYTFLDNITQTFPGTQAISDLYPAAAWAASITRNHPELESMGVRWWLPSSAEMTEIMRDITYNTSFWKDKPDIINRVLEKLTSIPNSGWSMLDTNKKRWTSSQFSNEVAYYSNPVSGIMSGSPLYREWTVSPITIYEF